jgi:hypothetical protein
MLWLNMLNHGGMPYGRMCCRLTTTLSSCVGVLKLEHFRVDSLLACFTVVGFSGQTWF